MAEILPHDINWPEIEARWQLEAELQKPRPRRVVPKSGNAGCGGRAMGCFLGGTMSLMFLLGLMLTLWAGLALLIIPLGVSTPGTVTRHEITGSRTSQSYFLHFRFRWNGQSYDGQWPISASTYTEIRDGEKVTVRCFPFAPGLRPYIEEGLSPWFNVWGLGPLGLLLLGISGVYLVAIFSPRRGKRLVRNGLTAPGIITRRDANEIAYLFRTADQTIEKTTKLSSQEWASFPPGEVVTVLFEPKRPQHAILYGCCDFRALG